VYVTITIQMPERVDQCLLILLRKLYVLSFCVPTQGWQLKPKSRWVNLMNKLFKGLLSSRRPSWVLKRKSEQKWKYLPAGIDCLIFSALSFPSTFRVMRYLGVRSLNLVTLVFLFFFIVIFSALGRCLCSLRMILMNSFSSLTSLG